MTRFIGFIDKEMRWWIFRYIDIHLHNHRLINSQAHEMYLNIAKNNKDNMLGFLDAEIVLRCLVDNVKDMNSVYVTHERLNSLIEYIKEELKHEEEMSREPLMYSVEPAEEYTPLTVERYEEPRIFIDDPIVRGVRTVNRSVVDMNPKS